MSPRIEQPNPHLQASLHEYDNLIVEAEGTQTRLWILTGFLLTALSAAMGY